MRRIVLDGAAMREASHLYTALAQALGGRNWQLSGVEAVIDVVFYDPAVASALPCTVLVAGTAGRPKIRAAVEELAEAFAKHRAWRRSDGREDLMISLQLA